MLSDLPEATPPAGARVGIQTLSNWPESWNFLYYHCIVLLAIPSGYLYIGAATKSRV